MLCAPCARQQALIHVPLLILGCLQVQLPLAICFPSCIRISVSHVFPLKAAVGSEPSAAPLPPLHHFINLISPLGTSPLFH